MNSGRPRPHDLVRLCAPDAFHPAPGRERPARVDWVVVSRGRAPHGHLAVTARGAGPGQRCAGTVFAEDVTDVRTPCDLVRVTAPRELPVFAAVRVLASLHRPRWVASWGPGGDAGFELASRVPAAGPLSALDLVLHVPRPVPPAEVGLWSARLREALPVRVNAQLQTPAGGVSADEFARAAFPVTARTADGPRRIADPWAPDPAPVWPFAPGAGPRPSPTAPAPPAPLAHLTR
ncbi:malonate decarboxylase holo-ACP synthase (plasmid) [Streptomyces sp. BI20]|uniref:malonate decarboxylase holo-ACP synthase n=1 Tax=Streptomyces sp. BI20 TaxID=3403460 RepID=UPI003C745664